MLLSAQGLALTPDERTLYLADSSRGILAIDLASRCIALLPCRPRVLALGIDGLYFVRARLVGVQNGVEPHRVVRLTLGARGDSLVGAEVLERQWERFGETGKVARPDQLDFPAVLRLRL